MTKTTLPYRSDHFLKTHFAEVLLELEIAFKVCPWRFNEAAKKLASYDVKEIVFTEKFGQDSRTINSMKTLEIIFTETNRTQCMRDDEDYEDYFRKMPQLPEPTSKPHKTPTLRVKLANSSDVYRLLIEFMCYMGQSEDLTSQFAKILAEHGMIYAAFEAGNPRMIDIDETIRLYHKFNQNQGDYSFNRISGAANGSSTVSKLSEAAKFGDLPYVGSAQKQEKPQVPQRNYMKEQLEAERRRSTTLRDLYEDGEPEGYTAGLAGQLTTEYNRRRRS